MARSRPAGVTPSPDALAEVNFIDSTLNPEFSRNSGMTVNETIKNGTNSIHGDGFEFYRDTFLTNGNYFSPIRPVFHQNLFGGTLGGPLIKNKLFAFASYQGLRNVAAQTTNTPVFGASTQLAGNFTTDLNESTGALNSAGLSTNPIPFAINGCAAGTPMELLLYQFDRQHLPNPLELHRRQNDVDFRPRSQLHPSAAPPITTSTR